MQQSKKQMLFIMKLNCKIIHKNVIRITFFTIFEYQNKTNRNYESNY